MKMVLLAVLMAVVTLTAFAEGPEFIWKGEFRTRTQTYKAPAEDGDIQQWIDSRVRLYMTSKFSDSLAFTYGIEVGDVKWGETAKGMPRDGINVETKHMYLDFTPDALESMKFRMGLQPLKDAFGSAIFDEDAVAFMVMPKMENTKINFGYVYMNDRMGAKNGAPTYTTVTSESKLMPVVAGSYSDLHFAMFDMNYAMNEDMNILFGAYYMNGKARDHKIITPYIDTDDHLELIRNTSNANSLWTGIGMTNKMNDTMTVGAQFIYLTEGVSATDIVVTEVGENGDVSIEEVLDYPSSHAFSYFAYAYGQYKMNDTTSFKLNFGYMPGPDGADMTSFHGINNMDYWTNFGLEYAFKGPVYDVNQGRLDYFDKGLMVISMNADFGLVYGNIGYMSATSSLLEDADISKYLGMEFDLGMKYEITKGLKMQVVGAFFLPGAYYEDLGNENEIGYELASIFKYSF